MALHAQTWAPGSTWLNPNSASSDRRIPEKQTIADEVAAWVAKPNADHATADWRFTTHDARVALNESSH